MADASPNRPTDSSATSVPAGFGDMVDAHWPSVFRLLWTMCGNRHDAEELTQETFLRALRRFDSFQPGSDARRWLLRIGTNTCLDLWRKRKRARSVALGDEPLAAGEEPGRQLELSEESQRVLRAAAELPETTRTVFHLRVTEGLAFREIGDLLELTEEAARWHMHQARTRLLKQLKPS